MDVCVGIFALTSAIYLLVDHMQQPLVFSNRKTLLDVQHKGLLPRSAARSPIFPLSAVLLHCVHLHCYTVYILCSLLYIHIWSSVGHKESVIITLVMHLGVVVECSKLLV